MGSSLAERFDLRLIRSNVRDSNADKGRWDAAGILRVLGTALKLALRLMFQRPGLVYLPLSQNHAGLARDVLYLSIARLFRVPVVAHLHGSMLPDYLSRRSQSTRRMLMGAIGYSARLVTCGEALAVPLRPLFGDRVVAIGNATPPDALMPTRERAPSETIAYMAHLSKAKGFYDVLAAAAVVLSERPDAKFIFAGERLDIERNVVGDTAAGPGWERFENLSAHHPGRVRWDGVVTGQRKLAFLRSADLFVLPSYAEAFPVAILEAMAASLPVIATGVGAIPDVVRPGVNGAIVKPGDPTALADLILRWLENGPRRAELARGALRTAQEFSVDRQAGALASLFTAVLEGKKS